MANSTLTEDDRALLAAFESETSTASELADRQGVDRSADEIAERLDFMADNGLLRHAGEGEYELTDDGRRLLRAPGDGSADETIDAPAEVVATLRDAGLRADRLDSALGAFAFLQFWGAATAAEIADGAFSEEPLEFDSAAAWWDEFARDHLAALPDVEPPETDDGFWRFTGRAGVSELSEDGRKVVFGRRTDRPGYASATQAMTDVGLSDDRRLAVSAALAALQRTGAADDETLREAAAGVEAEGTGASADAEWLEDGLLDVLEQLPGVVRDGDRWRYTLGPDGYAPA